MQPTRHRLALFLVTVLTSAFAMGARAEAADSLSTIPAQTAAIAYVQEWTQVLWGMTSMQTPAALIATGDPVMNPDGSGSQQYIGPDGTTALYAWGADGSYCFTVWLPDGNVQVMTGAPPGYDGVTWLFATEFDSSDGTHADCLTTLNEGDPMDPADDVTTMEGSAIVPGGITQTFSATAAGEWTSLRSAQSDGSVFTLSVPMAAPMYIVPDLSQGAAGTYAIGDLTVAFALAPTPASPDRWAALLCDLDDGTTGIFALNADFSGFGQVEQSALGGTDLVALVSWTRDGDVSAYSLDGQNLQLGPSGAALDFLTHRWETLSAFLGPASGAAATVRRHPSRPSGRGPRMPRTIRTPRRVATGAVRTPRAAVGGNRTRP
jgi:hypothetical protein